MAEAKIIIAYWGIKGRAEILRMLAEYVGLPYENKIYADAGEWFGKDKPALKSNFPNLPYIQDGDRIVTETEACILYLVQKSKRLDLVGNTAEEAVHITQIKSVLTDIMNNLNKVAFNKEGDVLKGIQENCLPKLTLISKHLGNNEWLAGKLTVVDFFLAQILRLIALNGDFLEKLPNLAAFLKRFDELPALKAYLASERNLKVPIYPPTMVNPNLKVL